MVTREDMLLFLEWNVSKFSGSLKEELARSPLPDINVSIPRKVAPNGEVYISNDPELAKAIGEVAFDLAIKAVIAFINSYSEQNESSPQEHPVESISDLRSRLDALEKRFNDTLPPTWLNQSPNEDSLN